MSELDAAMSAWWEELTQDQRHRWGEAWQRGKAGDALVQETLPHQRINQSAPTGWVRQIGSWADDRQPSRLVYNFLPEFEEFLHARYGDEYPRT